MGGGELHQQLKNLCVNTNWKYAVFWKHKHRSRMVLTWEDAYYCDDKKKNYRSGSNWFNNMNEHVKDEQYTQDHLALAVANMCYRVYSIGEGIVGQVAATGKHIWISGDQLGNSSCSLNEHFDERETQFTAGIRTLVVVAIVPYGVVQLGSSYTIAEDLKLVNSIKEIFYELQSSLMTSTDCSPCVTDLSTSSGSVDVRKYVNNQDRTMEKNRSVMETITEKINNRQESEYPMPDFILSALCNDQNRDLFMPRTLNDQMIFNYESHLEFETKIIESYEFPAGYELYEALGPAFCKQKNSSEWETMTAETQTVTEMPEETSSSCLLTQRSGSENLLGAVVASACCSDSDGKGSASFGQPLKSPLQMQLPPSDMQTSGSTCYSFERSIKGFSSARVSKCSEQLERSREPVKVGKKRVRPGESSKPRPRDRQLIQDRIKELRQLVPNGSKCSIDALLERTIKHMLFMQRMMKHADKLDKCAEFKLLGKETAIDRPSSQEQGSSWAMEIGSQLKVCPIIVENIGTDGQMLVEMMCDECVHILEITEAIRSLGLTILKSATDAYGDKTWMCFVVEGEDNINLHRMDILWSLLQIMESKTKK